MELFEMKWLEAYSMRLAHAEGDLGELSKDERKHLKLLMRKYELEQQSVEINTDLAQAKLFLRGEK